MAHYDMQCAFYEPMQPTVVLALQKMVEVEVDNLARLCGPWSACSLTWTISLEHVLGAPGS